MPFDKINRTLNKVNRTTNNLQQAHRNVNRMTSDRNNSGGGLFNRKKNEPSQADEGWVCKCGVKNTTKFCGECGSAPLVCPNCNIRVESKFCQECGTKISDE